MVLGLVIEHELYSCSWSCWDCVLEVEEQQKTCGALLFQSKNVVVQNTSPLVCCAVLSLGRVGWVHTSCARAIIK